VPARAAAPVTDDVSNLLRNAVSLVFGAPQRVDPMWRNGVKS
jgi:hypothetical protein